MGIANVKDPKSKDIWMGVNEKGFCHHEYGFLQYQRRP